MCVHEGLTLIDFNNEKREWNKREREREREREGAVMNFILVTSFNYQIVHIMSSNYFHEVDSKVNWGVCTLSCGCDVFQLHQSKAQSESNTELLLALLQDSLVSLPISCTGIAAQKPRS